MHDSRSPEPSRPTEAVPDAPDLSGVRDESVEAAPWRMELPWLGRAVFVISIVICLAHLYFNTISTLSELWVSALHFGLFGLLCALTIPMLTPSSDGAKRWVLGVDVMLGWRHWVAASI